MLESNTTRLLAGLLGFLTVAFMLYMVLHFIMGTPLPWDKDNNKEPNENQRFQKYEDDKRRHMTIIEGVTLPD